MVELREPERMTEEELRDFVLDVVEGKVWTSAHANGEGVNSFLSLLMSRLDEVDVDKVGAVWEYMDKASTRSVNGIPMFMSHRLMHLEDWKLAAAGVDKYKKARAQLVTEAIQFNERCGRDAPEVGIRDCGHPRPCVYHDAGEKP